MPEALAPSDRSSRHGEWVAHQRDPHAPHNEIQLLGHFEIRTDGVAATLPSSAQRLLALLALRGGRQHRSTVAGTLWVDMSEGRAAANLRTAVWRARQVDRDLLDATGGYLAVRRQVRVDVVEVVGAAHLLSEGPPDRPVSPGAIDALGDELLPEWYDDWVLLEREHLRQVRLHGLEVLCLRLTDERRFATAIEAGLLAVAAEPLRESSHRALMRAHVAEGNMGEAVRQFDSLARALWEHLRIEPSVVARALVAPCRDRQVGWTAR